MLQEMRKYSKSWIANIFLAVLALSFVSWGVGDMVSGRIDTSAAKIGSRAIDQSEYSREFQNAMKQEGQQRTGATLTADEARKLGLGDRVLERMINDAALDNAVRELGLVTSDSVVTTLIQRAPVFSGLTGQFDRQTFQRFAQNLGYGEQAYIEQIRASLTREQLTRPVQSGFALPTGYAQLLLSYFFEMRAAEFVVVDDKALPPTPVPPDAVLTAYIKAHAARFSTPEYRDVTFAWIAPADVMNQITVTDDQIRQAYEDNKATYVVPEKRDVEQLNFATEAAAKAAFNKAKSAKFEDIANEAGEKPTPQSALTSADLDAAVAKVVFGATKDAVTSPQKMPAGKWALFKVTAITPGVNKTIDQVKDEIRQKVAEQLAIGKLSDIANDFGKANDREGDVIAAGKAVGMHTGRATMDANGFGPDGNKAAAPDDPEFRALVARAEPGDVGDPNSTKANIVYVVSVNGSTPPKLKPLEQVRQQAIAAWTAEERAIRLKKLVQDLKARADREGSLAGIAKTVGAAVQKSPAIVQAFTDDNFSATAVANLFNALPGKAAYGPKAKGGGYIVAIVTGIKHPQLPEKHPLFLQYARQLSAQVAESLTDSYIAELREKQKVSYNRKVIDSVTGSSSEAQ